MSVRILSVLLAFGGCFLTSCTSPAEANSAAAPATAPAKSASAHVPGEKPLDLPKLEKGMTAAAIRAKLGAPLEIQPMPAPDGKAEVWIYKFEQDLGMVQEATGTRDTQMMTVGTGGPGMVTVKEPVYTLVAKKGEVTLSLLMFNDVLQVQKAKVEELVEHR